MSQAVTAQVQVQEEGGIHEAHVFIDREFKYRKFGMYGQSKQSFIDAVLEVVYADFDPRIATVLEA
jgi:hypothetical protein